MYGRQLNSYKFLIYPFLTAAIQQSLRCVSHPHFLSIASLITEPHFSILLNLICIGIVKNVKICQYTFIYIIFFSLHTRIVSEILSGRPLRLDLRVRSSVLVGYKL